MNILTPQKAKRLKKRLSELQTYEQEIHGPELLDQTTLTLAKRAVSTTAAYHRLVDLCRDFIITKVEHPTTRYMPDAAFREFARQFDEEIVKE